MKTTFKQCDVTLLFKDVSGAITPRDTAYRERMIQSGVHYSEMVPQEHPPSQAYMDVYNAALRSFALPTAQAVRDTAELILRKKGGNVVLVSLARAGTPAGILIKRCIKWGYGLEVPHYSISIIRGKGIDNVAMSYILQRHNPEHIQFIDGWTGKGAIYNELTKEAAKFPGVDCGLAVLSDPAHLADISGTQEDFLIPSSCLNSTVCGLISRTIYNTDIINNGDFHGVLCYSHLKEMDCTYEFIDAVEGNFKHTSISAPVNIRDCKGLEEVQHIAKQFNVRDINFVKPGIGETTRVLLRRVPWKILVYSMQDSLYLSQIYSLAKEKGVEVVEYPLNVYKACGIIRDLSDL